MGAKEIMETSGDVLGHTHITREEVSAVLKCIKVDKSPGSDQVHPQILWEAREEIAEALAEIFASSLSTGEVPEDQSVANVPLFQKDSKEKPGNYRPVSLTSVAGILRDRIYQHLDSQGQIRERLQ